MHILDLGIRAQKRGLCPHAIATAADDAWRQGYDAARLVIVGTKRRVVVLILARAPGQPGAPEHYLAAADLPERAALLGGHEEDSARP